MKHLESFHGKPLKLPWNTLETPLKLPWTPHWKLPPFNLPWNPLDTFLIFPLNFTYFSSKIVYHNVLPSCNFVHYFLLKLDFYTQRNTKCHKQLLLRPLKISNFWLMYPILNVGERVVDAFVLITFHIKCIQTQVETLKFTFCPTLEMKMWRYGESMFKLFTAIDIYFYQPVSPSRWEN